MFKMPGFMPIGVSSISSNNPDYFKTREGYVICKENSRYNLVRANVSYDYYLIFSSDDVFRDSAGTKLYLVIYIFKQSTAINGKLAENCINSTFYVPKNKYDLKEVIETINVENITTERLLIWTDYERINITHFWSNSANNWLKTMDYQNHMEVDPLLEFHSLVMFNGYGKFRNYRPLDYGYCVCVLNRKLKWYLQSSILFFVSCIFFSFIGLALRSRFQNLRYIRQNTRMRYTSSTV